MYRWFFVSYVNISHKVLGMLDRRTLPLSALRAFESAGRHLHMGRAGDELGVTHGAISHQVRILEQYLGIKLFIRANNRLKLTSSGEHLLDAVRDGFECIIDGALRLDPGSLTGSLIIGCTESTGASWAIRHIGEFQLQYPQIDVHVVEVQPQQKDIPREIDVAICYGEPEAGSRRVELLVSPPVFPVCSPRILHDIPAITRPGHLDRLTLLHDSQNNWSNWFTAMGEPEPENMRQIHFYSTSLSLTAARLGYGVALCNLFEIHEDLREGRLVKLLKRAVPESHNYYLLTNQPEHRSLRAELFEDWIKMHTAEINLTEVT
jgi:LysR family glycine cleavage system transcriptional activator